MFATLDEALVRARRRRTLPTPEMRRLLRERAGLTQRDLGQVLQVSGVAVCRWESGVRTPRGALLDRYLEVLNKLAREGFTQ